MIKRSFLRLFSKLIPKLPWGGYEITFDMGRNIWNNFIITDYSLVLHFEIASNCINLSV